MKKQTVVKKFISLVLGLVMVMGLAVPVMANSTELHTWDNTTTFQWNHTTVGDVTYFGEDMGDEIERADFSITNIFDTGSVRRPVISDGEHIAYTLDNVVYAHAPAVITILPGYPVRSWGNGFFRIDAPNPDLPFDGTRHALETATGTRTIDEYGWRTSTGETYVLTPGIYVTSGQWDGSTLFIVVMGDADDTQPPTTPDTNQTAPNLNTASTWAHEGINNAVAAGLVPQSLQNHYTNNITRAEFTALAVLLYETVTGREITGRVTFNDTNDVNVEKAAYIGIVSGTGNNNFSPNMQFNREQAAVILSRLADAIEQPLPQVAATFADNAQISSWAIESVGQVQTAGIMGGIGNNIFSPQGTFTREQSIVTILRLFEFLS